MSSSRVGERQRKVNFEKKVQERFTFGRHQRQWSPFFLSRNQTTWAQWDFRTTKKTYSRGVRVEGLRAPLFLCGETANYLHKESLVIRPSNQNLVCSFLSNRSFVLVNNLQPALKRNRRRFSNSWPFFDRPDGLFSFRFGKKWEGWHRKLAINNLNIDLRKNTLLSLYTSAKRYQSSNESMQRRGSSFLSELENAQKSSVLLVSFHHSHVINFKLNWWPEALQVHDMFTNNLKCGTKAILRERKFHKMRGPWNCLPKQSDSDTGILNIYQANFKYDLFAASSTGQQDDKMVFPTFSQIIGTGQKQYSGAKRHSRENKCFSHFFPTVNF